MPDGSSPARPGPHLRDRLAGPAAAALVGAVHLRFSDPGLGPRVMADEAGYLANAIFLVSGEAVNMEGTAFYAGGTAVLHAPLVWLAGDDRLALYRYVTIAQSVLAALVVLILAWTVRHLFATTRGTATLAGVAGGLYPAYVMHSGFSWGEALLAAGFAAAAACTLRLLRSPAGSRSTIDVVLLAAPVGLILGLLPSMHRRLLAPSLVVLVVLAVWAVQQRRRGELAVLGTAFAVVAASGELLNRYLLSRVWGTAADLELSSKLSAIGTADGASALFGALAGQTWYLLVGTAGLVGVALFGLAWSLRRRGRGSTTDGAAIVSGTDQVAAWFSIAVLGAVASLVAVSVVFVGSATEQAEYLLYGRYPEVVAPLLVALGIGWLSVAPRRATALAVGASAVTALGTWAILILGYHDRLERSLNRVNVAGAIEWLLPDPHLPTLLRGTLVTLAALAVIAAVTSRAPAGPRVGWRTLVTTAVVLALSALHLVSIRSHIVLPLRNNARPYEEIAPLVRRTGASTLGLDPSWGRGPRVAYSFRLPGVRVDTDDGTPCHVLVGPGERVEGTMLDTVGQVGLVERPPPCTP